MKELIEKVITNGSFYRGLFGDNFRIIESKRKMLKTVWELFEVRFSHVIDGDRVFLITVPNRVELLGKHTDYQGGETLLLTGPKNFFAIAASSDDGTSELVNADPELGQTTLRIGEREPEMITGGVGSHYTFTVVKRLLNNLSMAGYSTFKDVKSVFMGDIPIGGGTSGSSAKVITDFFIFVSVNGLLTDKNFISLITENGRKAGLQMNQEGIDDFSLSLSMYIAHYENGLDFGDLKGDRGVGTFGGSEDHTAILLGKRNKLLYCRYCPTRVLEIMDMPEDFLIVVAYSGRRAEKTKDTMEKYNKLSKDAASAVNALNDINHTHFSLLRDFFQNLQHGERASAAYEQLLKRKRDRGLAGRAYQFFQEREIMYRAVGCLKEKNISEFGRLMNESHNLSKKYLKNIVAEVDFLQKSANTLGAYGATGFGAGFGGSCYAIVPVSRYPGFIEQWAGEYWKKFPHYKDRAQFDVYPACSGSYWREISQY